MAETQTLPQTVRSLVIAEGDQETPRFEEQQLPLAEIGPHDLLVEVRAVSVNPVDTKVRTAAAPQPDPKVPGWDAAGVVRAAGAEAVGLSPGDEVFYAGDLLRPGTDAEFHVVDSRVVGTKPAALSHAEAAALPLTALTAWEGLFDRLKLGTGAEGTLLVVGAAGGLGSMVIQLAKQLTGLTVIATASRPESRDWVSALGADHVIDHSRSLGEQLTEIAPQGVDYVFSAFTEGQEEKIAEAMAPQSSLVVIDDPENLPTGPFKPKSIALHWEFMFTRTMFGTPDMARQGEILNRVAGMIEAGTLRSTLGETLEGLTPENLAEAHRRLESSRTVGKLVLTL